MPKTYMYIMYMYIIYCTSKVGLNYYTISLAFEMLDKNCM